MSKQNKQRHHFFRRKRKGGGGPENNGQQGQHGGQPGFQQGQHHSAPQGQPRPFQPGPRGPRLRVAFELDETLGMPITNGRAITGFQLRPGAADLLARLKQQHELVLWTVGSRSHVNKCLSFGLNKYFQKTFSWDEMPDRWKDVRKTQVDYLVDSSEEHRELARRVNLEAKYILVPAYGSPEDEKNPTLWAQVVGDLLRPKPVLAPPAPPSPAQEAPIDAAVAVAASASQPEPEPQPQG
jgi:hypothetical protein